MRKVRIKNQQLWVGGKEIPFIAGEVHYWRLNVRSWPAILDQVREMGIRIVSTYVPWHYHEYKKGRFDFTGRTDPLRNLKAFLQLTRREKFWLVIRPGPYIYSEWPNDGVPDHAYRYHRLHPAFQKYAEQYLREVAKIVKPFLATRRNGHIILVQADNEIDPWPDRFGDQYGLGNGTGLFQEILKKFYDGDLRELNRQWGVSYRSFDQAKPFIGPMMPGTRGLLLKGDKELKRNIDYLRFKHEYSRRYAEWCVDLYRRLGFDVPVYLNVYPFFYAHDWNEMQKICDAVGVDLYPTKEFGEDEHEHRKYIDKIRYLRHISKFPFIAEFESGIWHDQSYVTGTFSPNHYRLLALSALLGGAAGWSWYMLVNRDNWYMAPINEWGRVRPELYPVFKNLVSLFHSVEPGSWTKLTEVAVTFNPIQYAAKTMPKESLILTALYESDMDYEVYDPKRGVCQKPFLFYSGNQWLEEEAQKNLRRYVEKGGTLIAFRNYPRKNERFEPCSLVGFEDPESILFEFQKKFAIRLAPGRPRIEVVSSVYTFRGENAYKITADIENYKRTTVGYIRSLGKGKIIHLGVHPSPPLILEILRFLGVSFVSQSLTRHVKTAFFKSRGRYYLVAVNNGKEDKAVTIDLPVLSSHRGRIRVRDLVGGDTSLRPASSLHPFVVQVGRKDGKIFEFLPT